MSEENQELENEVQDIPEKRASEKVKGRFRRLPRKRHRRDFAETLERGTS